jgi:hypothetical protein
MLPAKSSGGSLNNHIVTLGLSLGLSFNNFLHYFNRNLLEMNFGRMPIVMPEMP